jgi:hypothetical protein
MKHISPEEKDGEIALNSGAIGGSLSSSLGRADTTGAFRSPARPHC